MYVICDLGLDDDETTVRSVAEGDVRVIWSHVTIMNCVLSPVMNRTSWVGPETYESKGTEKELLEEEPDV